MSSKAVERLMRRVMPSAPRLSYNPLFRILGNTVSSALALPFSEFRGLPPNHLRVRVGVGNRIFNNHSLFVNIGTSFWHEFFANGYANANSDIVEIGCGCGRIASPLNQDYFKGTYLGIDIDAEMVQYCRSHFPADRFTFRLSPHRSTVYGVENATHEDSAPFVIGDPNSKDFIFSTSLFTHLLEEELRFYMRESFKALRPNGRIFMSFFCLDYVNKGGRWTFSHQVGRAHVESAKYPEAAIAYTAQYIEEVARECEFREVSIHGNPGQSALVARK
jgi:SAM-dependent methyltransferase